MTEEEQKEFQKNFESFKEKLEQSGIPTDGLEEA